MLRLSKKTDLLLGVHDVRHCVFAEELVVALQDSARTGSGHKNRSHPITHCTNAIIAVRSLRRIVQAISRHRGDGRCPACPAPRNAARQSERRSSHIGTILAFTLAALLFVHARFSRFRNPAFMRLPPPRPQQRERAPSAARCGARTHSTSASARLPRSQCMARRVPCSASSRSSVARMEAPGTGRDAGRFHGGSVGIESRLNPPLCAGLPPVLSTQRLGTEPLCVQPT